jgi:hypothetical protein
MMITSSPSARVLRPLCGIRRSGEDRKQGEETCAGDQVSGSGAKNALGRGGGYGGRRPASEGVSGCFFGFRCHSVILSFSVCLDALASFLSWREHSFFLLSSCLWPALSFRLDQESGPGAPSQSVLPFPFSFAVCFPHCSANCALDSRLTWAIDYFCDPRIWSIHTLHIAPFGGSPLGADAVLTLMRHAAPEPQRRIHSRSRSPGVSLANRRS